MQDPRSYFIEHNLYDLETLKSHAQHNSVYVIQSKRFPDLVMLHYMDSCTFDNLWNTFSRMCRGLIVDMKLQTILAHPYDKFFNVGQVPETNYENIKDRTDFETSEKLDGSMLISFIDPLDDSVRLTTKGSFDSEHSYVAEVWLKTLANPQALYEYSRTGTLMFELIDSRFRIVIDYKKKNYPEGLYLIGYRDYTGRLYTYTEVASLATELGIPCPKTYQYASLDQLLEKTKELTVLEEGFVLRYPQDGLMVKIKGMAYLKAHRFISRLSDKNILEAVAEGVADPLVEIAPEEYRNDVIEKIAYFKSRKLDLVNQSYQYFADAPKQDRKSFALWVKANVKTPLQGCLFALMDGKPLPDKVMYAIIKRYEGVSSDTRI